nr:unnamed protein product [Callosobruchus chinensis]
MMLHHYNYPTSLGHFINYHQLEDTGANGNEHATPSSCDELTQDDDPRCRSNSSAINNKSFTIAAILGLKGDGQDPIHTDADRDFMANCHRLQLPVHRPNLSVNGAASTVHFSPVTSHGVIGGRTNVRSSLGGGSNMKHMSSSSSSGGVLQQSKKSCKNKRVRTIFTPEQLERLEAEFERQQYMVGPERLYLAHTLQLTEAQVKVWFQNRRIKWRKHHLELTHQRLAVLKQQQLLLDDAHPDGQDTSSSNPDT